MNEYMDTHPSPVDRAVEVERQVLADFALRAEVKRLKEEARLSYKRGYCAGSRGDWPQVFVEIASELSSDRDAFRAERDEARAECGALRAKLAKVEHVLAREDFTDEAARKVALAAIREEKP